MNIHYISGHTRTQHVIRTNFNIGRQLKAKCAIHPKDTSKIRPWQISRSTPNQNIIQIYIYHRRLLTMYIARPSMNQITNKAIKTSF